MEHRRIAPFGISSLVLAATTALASSSLVTPSLAATSLAAPSLVPTSSEQAAQGPYRGTYVCQSMIGGVGILRIPIDLVIRNGNVEFARPLLNGNGTRVVGNEMASGTIDGDGKVHLTSAWSNGGIMFRGDYSGTLTPSGGTLMGTQTWHSPRGLNGSRTCTAAVVQLAATTQSPPPQRSLPNQSSQQQPSPDQAPSQQLLPDEPPSEQ